MTTPAPTLNNSRPKHPIQVVSRRTNLSADVLRAWERRYEAVHPTRSPSGRRMYSDAEIARLVLLRKATRMGRSIAQVAGMSDEELSDLVAQDNAAEGEPTIPFLSLSDPTNPREYVQLALVAVDKQDANGLRDALVAAGLTLGPTNAIEKVLGPVLHDITALWSNDELGLTLTSVASALGHSLQKRSAGR